MKISKLPLRIEPGLVALLCAWFYFDPAGTFLPFVCAAALHEAGHLAMLLWLRQPVHSLCLGLQGAVLRTGPLRYRDELLAAAAGPAMNLALLLAFSRTLPRFALVNFCLLAYNLLPFYPLDGGRLLRAVLRTLLPLRAAVWAERGVCLLCGALLMQAIQRAAEAAGARMIVLETQTCNENAIAFYKRNGFSIIGFDLYSYSNDDPERHEVRIEMGKKLK